MNSEKPNEESTNNGSTDQSTNNGAPNAEPFVPTKGEWDAAFDEVLQSNTVLQHQCDTSHKYGVAAYSAAKAAWNEAYIYIVSLGINR